MLHILRWYSCSINAHSILEYLENTPRNHYNDIIMGVIASQITSLAIVYSIVYSDADQRKHQSSASLAFVWGIHPGTGEFPTQMASYAENVSISWRHHVPVIMLFLAAFFIYYDKDILIYGFATHALFMWKSLFVIAMLGVCLKYPCSSCTWFQTNCLIWYWLCFLSINVPSFSDLISIMLFIHKCVFFFSHFLSWNFRPCAWNNSKECPRNEFCAS